MRKLNHLLRLVGNFLIDVKIIVGVIRVSSFEVTRSKLKSAEIMKFVIAFLSLIVVVSVFGATDEDQWAEFKVN